MIFLVIFVLKNLSWKDEQKQNLTKEVKYGTVKRGEVVLVG